MARTLLRWGTPVCLAIFLTVVGGSLRAQGSQNTDVLTSLLTEVRGLRAAMEQVASTGPRVQLAMGRLQLQEQRVSAAVRKLDDLHDRRIDAERDIAQIRAQLVQSQEAVERMAADAPERPPFESQNKALKDAIALRAADVQRLSAEEVDAAAALSAEQSRWNEINQRLEELERALAPRR